MTDRTRYILRQAFRLHLGFWETESEIDQFIEYLASQRVRIGEAGE